MKQKFYAVKVGRNCGIYTSWADCEKEVKGFNGAKFKSFPTEEEALLWLGGEKIATVEKLDTNKKIESPETDFLIYTDGSCLKNPGGAGGWAAIVTDKQTGEVIELSGGESITTNNRMELSAALFALSSIKNPSTITLVTDSEYLKNAFTKNWLKNWQKRNWKTATGTDVKNRDLWEKLLTEVNRHKIYFNWVKGHAGNPQNERCDFLAKSEAKKRKK
ncbi:MAG: ribonuclease HI [Selenomonadaceae bacterium]|nr:ribonuclease HI [Selenomonadaceae bacterium]